VLAIFLIVLGIISTFVVPPVMRVLRERDAMVAKTASDNKKAGEQFDAAQADYEEVMKDARVQASSYRDDARAEGRKVVEDARADAEQQVMSTLQMAAEQLKRERDAVELDLRANVGTMSATLASRILGVEVTTSAAAK
jgi:F-type H+-transporting ATPase subunit b